MTYKVPNAQINDKISQKFFQISRPVHVIFKTDKSDYLGGPKTKLFLKVFPSSDKVLVALGSGIGTCSVFLRSFLFQHNVFRYHLVIFNNLSKLNVQFLTFPIPFVHFQYLPNISDTLQTFPIPSCFFRNPIETQSLVSKFFDTLLTFSIPFQHVRYPPDISDTLLLF